MESELKLDIRYYETDQMGIVHHSNYVRYFECGRTAMLKEFGLPIEQIEQSGVMLPVVSVSCRYRLPARLGDTISVRSVVDTVPMARLTIRNEIRNQSGQLLCDGEVVLGFIDSVTRRPVRCPKMLVDFLSQYINE